MGNYNSPTAGYGHPRDPRDDATGLYSFSVAFARYVGQLQNAADWSPRDIYTLASQKVEKYRDAIVSHLATKEQYMKQRGQRAVGRIQEIRNDPRLLKTKIFGPNLSDRV